MANIVIDLAAQFTGANAFKKADTATDKLTKNVKSLGRTLGLTLSVGAILAFGKAAVKAAAEDQAAQASLAQTIKNLGLETGNTATSVNDYISTLERQTGILDDDLRPAMDRLLRATGSVTESQKLLNLAIDISAGTGKDLTQVTQGLQKAFLGNVQGLGRLGVGLTKAELKTGNFKDITEKLTKLFAGQGERQADSYLGTIQRLGVAFNNAKEIFGQGLIDSAMILAGTTEIDDLQVKIENFATSAAENMKKLATVFKENETLIKSIAAVLTATFITTKLIAGVAATVAAIQTLNKAYKVLRATTIGAAIAQATILTPFGAAIAAAALLALIDQTIRGVDALTDAYNRANDAKDAALNPDRYNNPATAFEKGFGAIDKYTKKVTIITKQTKEQLAAAKLKLAIDKANLALGKGGDVFDIEKIQLAAAERNQAEQLGKITNQAQLLQITNDLARLEVKQSILALEEAIASKDVDAITAATKKLNSDLMIVGALTGQKVKLTEIESILNGMLPKDLINLANLNEAIRLLGLIGGGGGGGGNNPSHVAPIFEDPNASPTGFPTKKPMTPAEINAALMKGSFVPVGAGGGGGGSYASSGFPGSDKGYSGMTTVVVNVNAGTVANPEQLTTLIQDAVISLNKRGDLLTYAGSL